MAQTMFAVFHEILSAQSSVPVSVQLVKATEDDVEVLVRKILRDLTATRWERAEVVRCHPKTAYSMQFSSHGPLYKAVHLIPL